MGQFVYDADCGVCTKVANSFAAHARDPQFSVVSSQGLGEAGCAAAGFSMAEAREAAFYVAEGAPLQRGHLAIAAAMACCGGWRAAVGRVLTWPGISQVSAVCYDLFAKNRHRFPGPNACQVPDVASPRR